MKGRKLTEGDIERILSNPFYCIQVDETFSLKHKPLISEEDWIKGGARLIKEIGAEEYLKHLLENLKGNYV